MQLVFVRGKRLCSLWGMSFSRTSGDVNALSFMEQYLCVYKIWRNIWLSNTIHTKCNHVPHEEQKKVVITGWILCLDCTESTVTVGVMVIMMISLLTKDTSMPVVNFATTFMTLPPPTTITTLLGIILWREAKVLFVVSFWIGYLEWA